MSESQDMVLINPAGREVTVSNELGQELLLQDGFKVAGDVGKADEAKTEAPKEDTKPQVASAVETEAPKPRSRASK